MSSTRTSERSAGTPHRRRDPSLQTPLTTPAITVWGGFVQGRRSGSIVVVDIRPTGNSARRLTQSALRNWTAESEDRVVIDLSRAEFIDMCGLVLVASVAERASFDNVPVEFTRPTDTNVSRYISRMHLGECLRDFGVNAQLPTVNESNTGSRLFELHRFDPTGADELAESVYHAIIDHGGKEKDASDFYLGVSEVLSNVVDHSGVVGGWAAMQVLPSNNQLTFAVADVGFGLRKTLSANHQVANDCDAIGLAFRRGVTGTGETRGEGLPDLYDRVTRRSGLLRVWSGAGVGVSIRSAPMTGRPAHTAYPGTIIYASLKVAGRERGVE